MRRPTKALAVLVDVSVDADSKHYRGRHWKHVTSDNVKSSAVVATPDTVALNLFMLADLPQQSTATCTHFPVQPALTPDHHGFCVGEEEMDRKIQKMVDETL